MIDLFILTVGGVALAVGAGIKALSDTTDRVEDSINGYGKRVEARTRAQCDQEAAVVLKRSTTELNNKWDATVKKAVASAEQKAVDKTVEALKPYLKMPSSEG